ncbi:FCD domain-containing protein [Streptomyces sp. NPDC001056]
MQIALSVVAEGPEHRRRGCEELTDVLEAVRTGDPDAAESAMRAHIRRTRPYPARRRLSRRRARPHPLGVGM